MSYFPGMVKAAKGSTFDVYVLHIGDNGNYVVQAIGGDGAAESFVAGENVEDMLRDLACELSPNAELRLNEEDKYLVDFLFGLPGVGTWAAVAAILNDAGHVDHRVAKAMFYHAGWCGNYLEGDDGEPWELTDKGRAFDAKYFPAT